METVESPEVDQAPGEIETSDAANQQAARGDNRPWVLEIAGMVYRDRALRYQLYLRAITVILLATGLAWSFNPLVSFAVGFVWIAFEKQIVEKHFERYQMMDMAQQLVAVWVNVQKLAQLIHEHEHRLGDIGQRVMHNDCTFADQGVKVPEHDGSH